MVPIDEHVADVGGQPLAWRSAPLPEGADPVLYVHGVPDSGRLWTPFLARTGGLALDLPGFGRSGKRGDLDLSADGYARALDAFAELVGLERVRLVVHDWGAIALPWAATRAELVTRLVLLDAVPLLPGLEWHRLARVWRTRGLGELAMGASVRPVVRLLARGMPAAWVDDVMAGLDQGTQRAILRLYRETGEPAALAAAGARLGGLTAPALVAWGEDDPYLAPDWAERWADHLPGPAEVLHLPGAGHWPWLDRPELVDRVAAFLGG